MDGIILSYIFDRKGVTKVDAKKKLLFRLEFMIQILGKENISRQMNIF